MNILLALAWLVPNSSSMSGRIGENMVRVVKFMNHRNQTNRRKSKPLHVSDGNLTPDLNPPPHLPTLRCFHQYHTTGAVSRVKKWRKTR